MNTSWTRLLLIVASALFWCGVVRAEVPDTNKVPSQILTNAAQIRALSMTEATRGYPVRMTGTVMAVTPNRTIFIADETGGTFIRIYKEDTSNYKPGDRVEVEGLTFAGRFVPGIAFAKFKIIGRGKLPAPVPVNFDDLLSTRWHYERVEVRGVVHEVKALSEENHFLLVLAMGSKRLEVQVNAPDITNLAPFMDASVRIVGLATGHINDRRQLINPQLLVSRMADLHIETEPPADPFEAPLTSFENLMSFRPEGWSGHRVHVAGVVTLQQRGNAIFLSNDGHGLMVQTSQETEVSPGDLVDVVGFPTIDHFSASLEDAEFKKTGHTEPPAPVLITMTDALQGTNDAGLVAMNAMVVEVVEAPTETILVARSENTSFRARLPRAPLSIANGSEVRLTGICRVQASSLPSLEVRAMPATIELLLRSAADITVHSAPSPWTAQRMALAALTLLGVVLVALIWIALLRRQVSEQAGIIREKAQREAALEERHRMAREMHDTLAQSFSGLGFQLDALDAQLPSQAEPARRQLETARQMVRYGQEGFRRTLMNLRAQELERACLTEALPDLARKITANTGIELRCEIKCPRLALSESVESNVLRIGQECLTNAVRHASPKRIDLGLTQELKTLRLRIADDGTGFDPGNLNGAANGHFGWHGVRERAEQISAKIKIDSQPGRGTVITLSVPI